MSRGKFENYFRNHLLTNKDLLYCIQVELGKTTGFCMTPDLALSQVYLFEDYEIFPDNQNACYLQNSEYELHIQLNPRYCYPRVLTQIIDKKRGKKVDLHTNHPSLWNILTNAMEEFYFWRLQQEESMENKNNHLY